MRVRLDAEAILDQRQMAVVLAEKRVRWRLSSNGTTMRLLATWTFVGSARSGDRAPAKCCQSVLPTSIASNRHFSLLSLAYCAPAPNGARRKVARYRVHGWLTPGV